MGNSYVRRVLGNRLIARRLCKRAALARGRLILGVSLVPVWGFQGGKVLPFLNPVYCKLRKMDSLVDVITYTYMAAHGLLIPRHLHGTGKL